MINMMAKTKSVKNSISKTNILKIFKTLTIIFAIIQSITISGVMLFDYFRKRYIRIKNFTFPSLPPKTIQIKDSKIKTYTEGKSLYKDMLKDINSAKKYILFETYIWKDDIVGRNFKKELIKAARRGIKVFIVFDSFGNLVIPRIFKRFPKIPNLYVIEFPIMRHGLLTLNLRQTGRDHRKILVVDGKKGYVGGYNIGSLYKDKWRDTHMRIIGSTVWEIENAFVVFWNNVKKKHLPHIYQPGTKSWDSNVRAAVNNPSRLLYPVRGLYIDSIDRARKNIWITQAYFIPDKEILEALIKAARRGVDVKILIPEKSNHIIADWVASAYFDKLLDAGVEIWLYKNAMIHAKTCTVDGRWSTIGTANIDRLSMTGNFEINIQIWSKRLAERMEDIFRNDLSNSIQLPVSKWQERSIMQRVIEKILRPLSPIL